MPYVSPRDVEDPASCHFYHCIELPGLGLTEGHWDLRGVVDDYLGGLEFAGQRVLDIGTASGFLTFEMERRGADVVSFDIADGQLPDMVPYAQSTFDAAAVAAATHKRLDRLKNGYWLAHRLLESKARVVYGDVQALPTEIGHLDIALFGMILGHLRDPFGALHSAAQLKPATIVITNQTHPDDVGAEPYAHFMPAPTNSEAMAGGGSQSAACARCSMSSTTTSWTFAPCGPRAQVFRDVKAANTAAASWRVAVRPRATPPPCVYRPAGFGRSSSSASCRARPSAQTWSRVSSPLSSLDTNVRCAW